MLIYISNSKEGTKNPAETKFICNLIARSGHVPIAPRLYFPQFINSNTELLGEELLSLCDEVWVIGMMTNSMKADVEQANKEHIPIKHFINIRAMVSVLAKGENPTEDLPPARSLDELMGELAKVNDEEENEKIIKLAYIKARVIEPQTHMDRSIVENLLFIYYSMLHDMEKVEMTEEEKEILLREGVVQIAEQLHIDPRLAGAVILISREKDEDDIETISEVITEYCAEHVPEIARITGYPQSLVDKIVFISNIWRWRDRNQILSGDAVAWWPQHVKALAELLDQSEDLIWKILKAELTSQ